MLPMNLLGLIKTYTRLQGRPHSGFSDMSRPKPSEFKVENFEPEHIGEYKSFKQVAKPLGSVILLYAFAATAAISQHEFYSHVNGREPSLFPIPQEWVIRIGTTFAYLFQTTLAASVALVFEKASWYCFQQSAVSVKGIDSVFSLCSDPKQLFVGELRKKAKVVLMLALITWATQLTSILAPGTLTGCSEKGLFTDISG